MNGPTGTGNSGIYTPDLVSEFTTLREQLEKLKAKIPPELLESQRYLDSCIDRLKRSLPPQ